MKPFRILLACLPALLLGACLEVEQHPGWVDGQYNGKRDDLAYQARFRDDKLAWTAAIANRNRLQTEYGRARP